jgi:sulfatase maturation enzyme AslB (radical SAM superfamily)
MLKNFHINQFNTITFILTENCNLKCKYCNQIHSKNSLDLDFVKNFFNEVRLNEINKKITFEFFGGEPFLEFNKMKELIKMISHFLPGPKRNLIEIKINTNATIWNDEIPYFFKDLLEKNFNRKLIISYDGLWQDLRGNNHINEIIEDNINKFLSFECINSFTSISFSYNGLKNQNLVKNYLYILNKYPIAFYKINHYLIREPWSWNKEKFNKYIKDFKEFLKFDFMNFKNFKIHTKYIQNKIDEYLNPSLGCGFGEKRITLTQNKILDCGLDNDFNKQYHDKKITDIDIKYNCLSCEIFNYCKKVCPKKIFYLNKENKNYLCEIKKEEFKILKNYFQKYDNNTYKLIFKEVK